ncbi:phosphate acetyltransferase [Buchnera aphidicola]|uniref:phosphate acetyltransferase n=1 Tax=Buchnera aphidicola TaxID=9 RepID=UPI003464497F
MTRNIIFIPIGRNKEITSAILSYASILKKKNISFGFFSPFRKKNIKDTSYYLKKFYKTCQVMKASYMNDYTSLLNQEQYVKFLENILHFDLKKNKEEIFLIEGFSCNEDISINFFNQLNLDISNILNAEIIFVCTLQGNFIKDFLYKNYLMNNFFLKNDSSRNLGIIINVVDNFFLEKYQDFQKYFLQEKKKIFQKSFSKNVFLQYKENSILGVVSLGKKNLYISQKILLKELYVKKKYLQNTKDLLINLILLYKNGDPDIEKFLNRNTLLIIYSSDFSSLKSFSYFFQKNNIVFSILVIQNDQSDILKSELYLNFKSFGISIFFTHINSFEIFCSLNKINFFREKIFREKRKKVMFSVLSDVIFSTLRNKGMNKNISSYNFLYQLKNNSKKLKRTIILPEGENKKIIQAAYLCYKLNICNCVLFGNPSLIYMRAKELNLILPQEIKVYNPQLLINDYISFFSKIYKNFDLNECKKILKKNNIIISMILLKNFSKYHGLVAGIENTTADIIRPALKIIRMKKNTKLISSIFFMLFDKKVFVYGDCAINPNPSALDLSEIAIQSADSAKLFGIIPKIAMLSYSTNNSGTGKMVDKVKIATDLVRNQRPDLIIEGPIQYDSATDSSVARIKCPDSKIFGEANVFIFPDLNSGNITYKAVQRSCSIISVGPIIQGLSKPVNDLSRGATIQDIVYTIAVTSIQAFKKNF